MIVPSPFAFGQPIVNPYALMASQRPPPVPAAPVTPIYPGVDPPPFAPGVRPARPPQEEVAAVEVKPQSSEVPNTGSSTEFQFPSFGGSVSGYLDRLKQGLQPGGPLGPALINFGAAMSRANAPSTDPRSRSLSYGLGQGAQAFSQSMAAYRKREEDKKKEAAALAFKERELAIKKRTADAAMLKATEQDRLQANSLAALRGATTETGALAGFTAPELAEVYAAKDKPAAVARILKRRRDAAKLRFDQTTTLRNEFGKSTEELGKIIAAGERAQDILANRQITGLDQLQLLYNMVTALDPGSVVREGEIGLARSVDGLIGQMKLELERITEETPGIVSQNVARGIAREIVELAQNAAEHQNRLIAYYEDLARASNIEPWQVMGPTRALRTVDVEELD